MSNWFNNISCVASFDCNSNPFTRDACVNILQRVFNPCWMCSCSSHISFQYVAPCFYDFHGITSTTYLHTDRYLCSMPAAWSELLLVQLSICGSAKCHCTEFLYKLSQDSGFCRPKPFFGQESKSSHTFHGPGLCSLVCCIESSL